jgi:hypothetical protein
MIHDIVRDAIISKRSLTAHASRGTLRFSPHAMGRESDGTVVVVGLQYAGPRGEDQPGDDWCCLRLDDLAKVEANGDPWLGKGGQPPRDHLESIDIWTF